MDPHLDEQMAVLKRILMVKSYVAEMAHAKELNLDIMMAAGMERKKV